MFFTKVELHNYGVYKGTHEMCLTDRVGHRNITLIGGMNGRGKTTFHDAVLIALYGKQALKYIQEKARSYDRFLIDRINKHTSDEETYVAVSLSLDDGTLLRVKRSWQQKMRRLDQHISVEKNGVIDKYLGESWSYYIEEILPFGIARFFFFNNEKITQLADDTSFEQIKVSIKSAIGVSSIEKAIEHVDEVIRRKKNALLEFEKSEANQGFQDVENQLAEIAKRLEESRRQADVAEVRVQNISARLDAAEKDFWSAGGDLSRNRDSIKAEMEKINAEVENVQSEILQLVSDASTPLFMCRDLVVQAYNSESDLQKREAVKFSDAIIIDLQKSIKERLDNSGVDACVLDLVKSIIDEEISKHQDNGAIGEHISLSATSMMLFERLISNVFQSITQRIAELINHADAHESELLSLDAHLEAADEKALAIQLFDVLKGIEKEKNTAEAEHQRHLATIESLDRQRDALMAKRNQLIKTIAEKENTNDDNIRIAQYAAMSMDVLKKFKIRLQKEKIRKLADTATTCFVELVEKNSLISRVNIDPETLDVTIIGAGGKELLKNQLSAGEQQMFAISIVWALALTSGYKAPVIIDTPMARLDSSNRANFVTKYLPAASSQVLVLSTDEEMSGRYLDMVRENVVDYYTLLYCEDEQCTSIIRGYFEEARI